MKFALIGAGERGMIYSAYAHDTLGYEIAAVADTDPEKRALARERYQIPESLCFSDGDDLIRESPEVDALIIASMDRDHYGHTMAALERGWDILLEKPISPDAGECLRIRDKAEEKGCSVTVCHVLRYAQFFMKLKEILESGELGKVIAIDHTENVGNFHIAHSFVRGNWRKSAESSPIIMQKSCHDLDILLWLTGSTAERISSFGSTTYFKESSAPAGSADRCLDCPVADSCRFDARKAYLPILGTWPAEVLTPDQTEEGVLRALRGGPYGRCVYRCDNDVCDHQSTVIEFSGGITAAFTLSGLTNRMCRTIHIMCEDGEISGDDDRGEITVTRFRSNNVDAYEERTIHVGSFSGAHGGGDRGLMDDFIANITGAGAQGSRSSIARSIESHLMACAAEESRLTGKTVEMADFEKRLGTM